MAWIGAAAGVVGGLLSSGDGGGTSTSQQSLDPRVNDLLWGPSGDPSKGLLYNAQGLFNKQNAQGGLNPLQQAGLEYQRQAFTNPGLLQGYNSQMGLGQGLLNQPVAGNPFATGLANLGAPSASSLMSMGRGIVGQGQGVQGGQQPPPMAQYQGGNYQPFSPQMNSTLGAAFSQPMQAQSNALPAPAPAPAQSADDLFSAYLQQQKDLQWQRDTSG